MANRPNIYVQELYNILNRFQNYRVSNQKNRDEISATYASNIAERRVAEAITSCSVEYGKARDAIESMRANIMSKIDLWAVLDPHKINDDAELLTEGFNLTSVDLQQIANRNAANYTMLRMINDYVERHSLSADHKQHSIKPFIDMPTIDGKKDGYNKLINSAVSLLDTIYNAPVSPIILEAFMDANSSVCIEIYKAIGEGREL